MDIQIIILVASVTIVYKLLRGLDLEIQKKELNKLIPYSSTTTNMEEVEKKLESYKKCDLNILGNSLSTMWNSLLKHFFTRIKNKDLRVELNVKLIKKVDNNFVNNPIDDPVISSIIQWFNKNKPNIKIEIFVIDFPVYFTGICMNDDFLKYRFLNRKTSKEIIGAAYRGTGEIPDRTIEWFLALFNEICESNNPLFIYPNK